MSGILRERAVADAALALWPNATAAERETRVARAAWAIVAETGDGIAGRTVRALGPVDALVAAGRAACGTGGPPAGVGDAEWAAAVRRWRPRLAEGARLVAAALGAVHRRGLTLLVPEDGSAWPEQLADLGDHAPPALWVRGDPVGLAGLRRGDWHVAELKLALLP